MKIDILPIIEYRTMRNIMMTTGITDPYIIAETFRTDLNFLYHEIALWLDTSTTGFYNYLIIINKLHYFTRNCLQYGHN